MHPTAQGGSLAVMVCASLATNKMLHIDCGFILYFVTSFEGHVVGFDLPPPSELAPSIKASTALFNYTTAFFVTVDCEP